MSQPAKRHQLARIVYKIKQQSWILLLFIMLTALVDYRFFDTQFLLTKSLSVGFLLSFIIQLVFTSFVFFYTGFQARHKIVRNFYQGQLIKWLLTVIGFIIIFNFLQPIMAFAVILGFIGMYLIQSVLWLRP